jgi:arylsulfatase A-like enzyme
MPNVLIIVTDDQQAHQTLGVMPATRRWFVEEGTRFRTAFATTPQCCPSRATIFSGRYAHNHGVRRNRVPENLDQELTLQRYLDEAGYETALFGKFLTNWRIADEPAHFDRFAFPQSNSSYSDIDWNVNGQIEHIDAYSTDYIRKNALDFIRDAEGDDDRPWFMYLSTRAPHSPYTPEPKYANASVPRWRRSPATRERNLSDKPPFVVGFVRDSNYTPVRVNALRREQLRTLMSVDDLIAGVMEELRATDEDDHTLAILLSDNGYMWFEHRLAGPRYGKRLPYEGSVRIPLLMRWAGRVEGGAIDDRLASAADIAPTVLDAAGLSAAVEVPLDGRSLLSPVDRPRLLLEHWPDLRSDVPKWAALRSETYLYVEYYRPGGKPSFAEYYDLVSDPWQLRNLLGDDDRTNDPNVEVLSKRLKGARRCSGQTCP